MDRTWYFAYGSNMQGATFRGRRGIAPTRVLGARLAGWRLVLDKPGLVVATGAMANLVRAPDAEVWGALYEITPQELEHLDLTEGVLIGNYRRVEVAVEPIGAPHAPVAAWTFVSDRCDPTLRPTVRYMGLLVEGAEEHGLPAAWVAALRAVPVVEETAEELALRAVLDEAFGLRCIRGRQFVLRRASLDEVLPLRHRELRPGRAREAALFDGDHDASTAHFGAFLADGVEVVTCATFMARDWRGQPAYQLRGMATRADLVRTGIGSSLLRQAEALLPERGRAGLLWCNARVESVAFYEKLGWEVASTPFDIPDVGPHQAMVRRAPFSRAG